MVEPTDAQIEAAAKAIASESGDCIYWIDVNGNGEVCWKHKRYSENIARAALEAAFGVTA